MYKEFTAIKGKELIIEEREFNDDVFYSNPHSISSTAHKSGNEFFNKPDYTRHIFKNFDSPVYTIDANNCISFIRENNILQNLYPLVGNTDPIGVYIVERLLIQDIQNIDKLLSYYLERGNLENDMKLKEFYKILKEKLDKHIPDIPAVLRIITFIPKQDLIDYNSIFLTNMALGIVLGNPDTKKDNPLSTKIRLDDILNKINLEDSIHTIGIEIIDNENPNKPYYTKLGNNIIRINSVTSDVFTSGGKVVVKKNNNITDEIDIENIDDLERYGFYSNKELAMCNGNIKEHTDLLKLNNTNKKIDLEKEKLEAEKRKLEAEIEIKNKEIENLKNKIEAEKRKIELERDKLKLDNELKEKELENVKSKLKNEKEKHKLERDKIKLENKKMKLDIEKMEDELRKFRTELEHKKAEFEAKLRLEKEKLKNEKNKVESEKEKMRIELERLEIELRKTILSEKELNLKVVKARLDYVRDLLKMEYDKTKHKIDMDIAFRKFQESNGKSLSSIVSDIRKIFF